MSLRSLIGCFYSLVLCLFLASGIVSSIVAQSRADVGDGRIINGQEVNITQVPWQVAVLSSSEPNDFYAQNCGASILDENWVLSAAHCFVFSNQPDKTAADIEILAGVTTLGEGVSSRIAVQQIIPHPAYDPATTNNDIALLKLATPVGLNGTTKQAISLPFDEPKATWPAVNTSATVSGWGNTSTTGSAYPSALMAAEVDVLTNPSETQCGSYSTSVYLPDTMLCAAEMTVGKDSCQGDSGGPLAIEVSGTWTLAGIVSWGYGCADPQYPGVYTRVTSYLDWIEGYAPELKPDDEELAVGGLPAWLLYAATQQQEPISQLGAAINGAAAGDGFGGPLDLSADGQYLAIGRATKVIPATKPGTVKVFEWSNEAWQQRGSTLDGEEVDDYFGQHLAISDDGNRLVVGAYANDGGGANAGSVRVFEYISGDWAQLGQDIDGEDAGDGSGRVAISGDGAFVAVGAPANDDGSVDDFRNIGKVRVYQYDGSAWVQAGQDITGEADVDQCCDALALSADGGVLAAGAGYNDGNGNRAGHVRVFQWNGVSWSQVGTDIDGEAAEDLSGRSISLSSDGSVVAIGAALNGGNGNEAGHVRVFRWDGVSWSQVGSDIDGEAAGDSLGQNALSGDGSTLVVSAGRSDVGGDDSGNVRVFRYVNNDWTQVGKNVPGAAAYDGLGAVAISADGARFAVGSGNVDSNGQDSGQVKVFQINTGD